MVSDGKFKHIESNRIHKLGLFGLRLIYIPITKHLQGSQILSSADQERFSKFKIKQKKREFLTARIALNKIDKDFSQKISYEGKRPFLKGEIDHISLSHSMSHAVAAWHPTLPIGVDIESDRVQLKMISKKFLTPREINKIE